MDPHLDVAVQRPSHVVEMSQRVGERDELAQRGSPALAHPRAISELYGSQEVHHPSSVTGMAHVHQGPTALVVTR